MRNPLLIEYTGGGRSLIDLAEVTFAGQDSVGGYIAVVSGVRLVLSFSVVLEIQQGLYAQGLAK